MEEKKEEIKKEKQENNIKISDEVLSRRKNMSKGIKVEILEKSTKIDVNIIVEYGARIPEVAFEIQKRVKKSVENMTGLNVEEVNVHVQGVSTVSNKKKEEPKEVNKEEKKEPKKEAKKEEVKKEETKKADAKKTTAKKEAKKK